MTGLDFLDFLESNGIVDSATIAKVKGKVAQPGKVLSAGRVAKYLIDKEILNEPQAKNLLRVFEQEHQQKSGGKKARFAEEPKVAVLSEADLVDDVVDLTAAPVGQAGGFDDLFSASPLGPQSNQGGLNAATQAVEEEDAEKERMKFQAKKALANKWESKWMYIGSTLVVFLAIFSYFMYYVLMKQLSEKLYGEAETAYASQAYADAANKYSGFAAYYTADKRTSAAKVRAAMSRIRVAHSGRKWEQVLEMIPGELSAISEEEAFSEKGRSELAGIFLGTVNGLLGQAENVPSVEEKEKRVPLIETGLKFLRDPSYVLAEERKNLESDLSKITERLDTVKIDIEKEKFLVSQVAAVNAAIEAQNAEEGFKLRRELLRKFPVVESDPRVVEMTEALRNKEQDLVVPIQAQVPVTDQEDALPGVSKVVFTTKSGKSLANLETEKFPLLTRGAVYMFNAGTGDILWRRHVGFETRIEPSWISGPDSDLIVADQRLGELLRLNGTSGEIVWRAKIGEPFNQFHIANSVIYVSTNSGKLVALSVENGSVGGAVNFPQQLIVGPTASPDGSTVYQAGLYSHIYALNVESSGQMKCNLVYFLGHQRGSVLLKPILVGSLLFVVENIGPDRSQLHVLKVDTRANSIQPAQAPIQFSGIIAAPPRVYSGKYLVVLSDRGDLRMLATDNVEEGQDPVITVASVGRGSEPGTYSQFIAESGKLFVGDKGLTFYNVQIQRELLSATDSYLPTDNYVGPFQVYGQVLIEVRARRGSQMVSVAATSTENHEEYWRTDFAAPLAGAPIVDAAGQVVATTNQGDFFVVNDAAIQGKNTSEVMRRVSAVEQDLAFNYAVPLSENRVVYLGPGDKARALIFDPKRQPEPIAVVDSPLMRKSLVGFPVAFGDVAIASTRDGQVMAIDPKTMRLAGAPFQPAIGNDLTIEWTRPAVIDAQSFLIGESRGFLYLVQRDGAGLTKGGEHKLADGSAFVGEVATANGKAIAVEMKQNGFSLVQFTLPDLTPEKKTALPAAPVFGPRKVGEVVLVGTNDGKLHALTAEGEIAWSQDVSVVGVAGAIQHPQGLLVTTLDGRVLLVDPASGQVGPTVEPAEPFVGDPLLVGDRIYANTVDGTLVVIEGLK